MSLKKRVTAGLVWTFTEQFGNQLIGFVISVILARILLPEQFGLIGMIAVFIAIGNALLHAGLTKSLIRGKDLESADYSTVFYFNLSASFLIYFFIYFSAPLIAQFYEESILIGLVRLYCTTFIISAFSAVQLARLTKKMEFRTQTIIAIPSAIVGGFVGIVMALSGYGVWSLVWSSISGALINSILLWLYSDWRPELVFDFKKLKNHFNFGYKLTLSELLDRTFSNLFLIAIGKYFSAAQVGFYTRAETMNQLPVKNISRALDKVTFPLFSKIQNDDKRLKRVYGKILKIIIFVITPLLIYLAVLAEPIFRFLFTEKWLPAVPYFQILCVTGILYPLHSYNLDILNVKGRSDLFLKLEIFKKVLILLVLFITIPMGIIELLFGQVIISFLAFFINAHYTGKFINYSAFQQILDISPILIIAGLGGGITFLVDHYWMTNYEDILRILIGFISGGIFYITISYILKMESLFELYKIILKK
ncbi:lipopolysaccharide biosynthesis protein [Christiangramia sp.]|uniref:lipopolysaccharide biosynthesis protein n=1 Tax=Christiangramia sp. TaxID=1931228 RepID=UPI0026204D3A|nr:lipopolysaccharide biosynthesis protein [Christiangramia sp.]